MSGVYNAAANVGRTFSKIGLVIGIVIAVVLVGIGILGFIKPADPKKKKNTTALAMVTVIGLLVGLFTWGNYYLTQKYKVVAAGQGVGNVLGLFLRK